MNKHLRAARLFAKIMDNQFSFLGISFGLDALIGIIPGGGDVVSVILSLYLIWIGVEMKLPTQLIWKMVTNVAIDFVIGVVPIIGDIGDVFFKANLKNLQILEDFDTHIIDGEIVPSES